MEVADVSGDSIVAEFATLMITISEISGLQDGLQ